jgi:peptidoglycan-N-acetylglucosamine deacetylase
MNILGIDFEEWYHPQLIQKYLTNEDKELKITNGLDEILDWLRRNETYATFFIVGDILEKKPDILDKINSQGHEIGFHTMFHNRLDDENYNKEKFRDEIKKFNELTNNHSKGFRAPTFSLNEKSSWVIDVLEELGYEYDSSIVPVKTRMYGLENAEEKPYFISSNNLKENSPNGKIKEFPLLVTKFLGKKIPAAGGFYVRTLPTKIIKNAIKKYEKKEIPATFYIHSWELTPQHMPKISMSKIDSFITYHNLEKSMKKMDTILKEFKFTSFEKYLKNN